MGLIILFAALVGAVLLFEKYHTATAAVSAVKAEITKLKLEAAAEYSAVSVEVRTKSASIVARIESLL